MTGQARSNLGVPVAAGGESLADRLEDLVEGFIVDQRLRRQFQQEACQ